MIAVGLALGGWFIGHGFTQGRSSVRYVEVKGLAEREVTADLAFLTRHGVDTTAVQLQALEVSDADANRFPGERAGPRFVIQQTVIVRSRAPDVVMPASQRVSS
jgi:hypothetical protein